MKTEHKAWEQLQEHAAARLRPGFGERAVRLARAGREAAPSLLSQFLVGAGAAALCLAAVVLSTPRPSAADSRRTAADWGEISAQVDDLDQIQGI